MEIRLATTAADAALADALIREYGAWLVELAGISGPDALPPGVRKELAGPYAHYTRAGGAILLAGEAGLLALRPDADGGAELKRLYVRPAARGSGAGRALLEAGIALARERGYTRLWLETSPLFMPAAHALYARAGFRETPARRLPGIPDHVIGMERRAA